MIAQLSEKVKLFYAVPLTDFVDCGDKRYEVNTIGMGGFAQFLNPSLALRNEMYDIRGCAETMIWEVNEKNIRKNMLDILHCLRYNDYDRAIESHHQCVEQLKSGDDSFFTGDGEPIRQQLNN